MDKLFKIIPWSFLIVSSYLLASEQEKPLFTVEELGKLSAGEVVFTEPDEPYLFEAAIQIDASASAVWDLMLNHDRVPEYVKGLKELNVLESGENWKVIEHRLMLHPLLPKFYYVFREQYGPGFSIAFDRVKGSFKQMNGWWKIFPTENEKQVILAYSTYVEVGFFIPKSWINRGIRKRVPSLLTTFRDVVLSDLEKAEREEANR